MLSILREKLIAQAVQLSRISSLYRREGHRFVEAYFSWLEGAEQDIGGLRSSLSLLLQAEKSLLSSVADGYMPPYLMQERSIRKRQRAAAAHSLEKVSEAMREKIDGIDRHFEELNEKMAQAVAVLASKDPELFTRLTADTQGIATLWRTMGSTPETSLIYNYFMAKISASDREYLLADIIANFQVHRA